MSARIVIVGGGSYHWAPRLLCDFANTPSLADAGVVLHDLDADRLKLMEELGGEIASRRGIGLRTTAEPDRKRHLLRVWIAPLCARPLPEVFAQRFGSVTPGDRGGITVKGSRATIPFDA